MPNEMKDLFSELLPPVADLKHKIEKNVSELALSILNARVNSEAYSAQNRAIDDDDNFFHQPSIDLAKNDLNDSLNTPQIGFRDSFKANRDGGGTMKNTT